MAKRLNYGRCVHCLQHFDDLTRDHVLPKAWYPDTTPENLQRWTIPSCKSCNKEYGKLEEDLLVRLGMCLESEDAKSSGITDKVLRSIDPEFAENREEKRKRQSKKEKIIKQITLLKKIPGKGILPNFDIQSKISYTEYGLMPIPQHKLERFAHKLVRGITYIIDKSFIENEREIKVSFVHDYDAKPIVEQISMYQKKYECGPGIKVECVLQENVAFYAIEIWGRLKMYAIVRPVKLPCQGI